MLITTQADNRYLLMRCSSKALIDYRDCILQQKNLQLLNYSQLTLQSLVLVPGNAKTMREKCHFVHFWLMMLNHLYDRSSLRISIESAFIIFIAQCKNGSSHIICRMLHSLPSTRNVIDNLIWFKSYILNQFLKMV